MKVARTPLEGARAEEARWAGLLPGEEPGRGLRRQVEEVEVTAAAMAATMAAAVAVVVAVVAVERQRRHRGRRSSTRTCALRGARAHFEMPGPEGAPYQQKAMNRTPLM